MEAAVKAMILGELYKALVKAGADESSARNAAAEVASFDSRIHGLEGKLSVLQWMAAANIALSIAILTKVFFG